jgi:hypothetical protein
MTIQRFGSAFILAATLALARSSFAGNAEAAPGAHRPEWVIWAALAALMLLLLGIIAAANWPGRRKGGGKTGLPYL